MNIEEFREYCLSKPNVNEAFPFDETTLVFKLAGKIFAITDVGLPFRITLKCNPAMAVELRENYSCVKPGYHMNKNHWNTIEVDGSIPDRLIFELTNHSYELVVNNLPKSTRNKLNF